MKTARLIALAALLPCLGAHASLQRMSDDELSQVHAAGLPASTLHSVAIGLPLALVDVPVSKFEAHDLARSLDRQQAINQVRLSAAATQGSIGLMQVATLPVLFTPMAPLFMPTLAMPFPFFALPPKKPEPGQ
jgi:hypothetical protein